MAIFSYEQLDELGDGLIRQYLGKESGTAFCVDIEGFVTDFLHLPLLYRSFAERDTDKIGFISDGITPLLIYEKKQATPIVYEKGTIVIERFLRQEPESGRRRFTISHEGAHFVMDRTVPQASFHREFDSQRVYSPAEIKELFSFKEAMIDRLGASLLMPQFILWNVMKAFDAPEHIPIYGDSVLRVSDRLLIQEMANAIGASFAAFLYRLKELGILQRHDISEYIVGELGIGTGGDA